MVKISEAARLKIYVTNRHCEVGLEDNGLTLTFEKFPEKESHKLRLDVNPLTKKEVYAIARIVNAGVALLREPAFVIKLSTNNRPVLHQYEKALESLHLHTSTTESLLYLRRVLAFKTWSHAHKLALLVSGALVVDEIGLERTWDLANAKVDPRRDWDFEHLINSKMSNIGLIKHYLLPGVISLTGEYYLNSKSTFRDPNYFYSSKVVAAASFISLDHPTRTLREHYQKGDSLPLQTSNKLNDLGSLQKALKVLESDYLESVLDMPARKLLSIAKIVENTEGSVTEVALNRLLSLDENVQTELAARGVSSIDDLMTDQEKVAFELQDVSELRSLYRNSTRILKRSLPTTAVIVQIFIEQGIEKASEVMEVLNDLCENTNADFLRDSQVKEINNAFSSLALEVLDPEKIDYPFDWIVQITNHADEIKQVVEAVRMNSW